MKPKKSLGQNFLVNVNAARRIAALLEAVPGEQVVEIGSGRGDLTRFLLQTGAAVTGIELDDDLATVVATRFRDDDSFRLVRGDILELDLQKLIGKDAQVKVAGNIPYKITSPILEWIVNRRHQIPLAVLTVQREVADRLAAVPGSKDFGALTVFAQLFYRVRRVFVLRPGSFFPKPTVDSAVIELRRLETAFIASEEYVELRRLTSACFRWRRKTILRILREEYHLEQDKAAELLAALEIEARTRPEQLAVAEFVALMRKLRCISYESP